MIPYVSVTGLVGLIALLAPGRRPFPPLWGLMFVILVLFVGLRHHVGMDWNNYLLMLENVSAGTVTEAVTKSMEPFYALMLWIAGQQGWGIYSVNLVGALILMLGLFRYAKTTPMPWIALLVAMPFVVIVMGMSANRQAVANGVLLWVIAGWRQATILKRSAWIGFAATFHASAIAFLIFVLADIRMRLTFKVILLGFFSVTIIFILIATEKAEYYDTLYLTGQTSLTYSSGAVFHVFLNAGPVLIYLTMVRFRSQLLPNTLHRQMAWLAVALVPLALVASAAAGRISMYLFPVSMYIFSALPSALRDRKNRNFYNIMVYNIMASVFFVGLIAFWLIFSNTGFAYMPYENMLIIPSYQWWLCCK